MRHAGTQTIETEPVSYTHLDVYKRQGLLRRGDADAALAHDTGRQRGRALQCGADAVRADGGDRTDRHLGQGLGKSRIGQLHHGQRTACLAKAAGSGSQLGGSTGQGLPGAQGLGGLCKQLRCHRDVYKRQVQCFLEGRAFKTE